MKICVTGLGLIGGSICLALKRAGIIADGWDISPSVREYALNNGIVGGIADSAENYDTVIIAMPYSATVSYIRNTHFKNGATVADICGVKGAIDKAVKEKPRNFNYVGCHPMAGKEVSGIENAEAGLFDSASMVITRDEATDMRALENMRTLTRQMGFKRIVECTAEVHDKKIAYTSQLAHIVSNAYVKDGEIENCLGFTGGSFQDMTRIAGVDENIWAELYLANAGNVSSKIGALISSLREIKDAVDGGNIEKLRSVLRRGRELFDGNEKISSDNEISVQNLK